MQSERESASGGRDVQAGQLYFSWRLSKPTTGKTSSMKSAHEGLAAAHQAPDQSRSVVFDHHDDRSLIEGEMRIRNPAVLVPVRAAEGRVDAACQTVLAVHLRKLFERVQRRWQYDFRRKRQRCDDGPRRQRAIVRPVRHASRAI